MIFLTVGTWRTGYDRLVKTIDDLVSTDIVDEEIIAQTGYGSYHPSHLSMMEFCSPVEFVNIISRANVVISHAGMGTIIEVVKQNKPLIVLPRKPELGEVDNDHQFTTARQLEKEGKILVAYEVSELAERVQQAKTFTPTQGDDIQGVVDAVQKFICKIASKRNPNR